MARSLVSDICTTVGFWIDVLSKSVCVVHQLKVGSERVLAEHCFQLYKWVGAQHGS